MTDLNYILCRPHGGINDSLVQIERCCRYAEKNGRVVVVDTNFCLSPYFRDDFSNYFVSCQPNLILDYDSAPDDLNTLTAHPPSLSHRLNEYSLQNKVSRLEDGVLNFFQDESGTPIAVDSQKTYKERVVVHQNFGGGRLSASALSRLKLHPSLKKELARRIRLIPHPYTSVHIRNTDYSTNYVDKLPKFAKKFAAPYFLATDSGETRNEFTKFLDEENVFSFARYLSKNQVGLHKGPPKEFARTLNTDAILDLIMLALGERYVFFTIDEGQNKKSSSGFSRLAKTLHTDRKLLNHLIDSNDPVLSQLIWAN